MTKREIFIQAQQCSTEEERERLLQEACAHDAEMRAEIESLLAYDREDMFLEEPAAEAPADPVLGSTIGPYKVIQEIGQGGMGVVYMAEQRQPIDRKVALKIIKVGMDTRQVIARFEAERQALALMEHPNIATVIEAGESVAGRPYFVMELVRGLPLTTFCDRHTLSTRERLTLFSRVCHAVHHAHQKGIIHRDIKPNNVLVTLVDGEPVPKIIDFGIAKATNVRLTEKTLFTAFENFVGTPMYVSPEQMEMSGQDVDTRSDIYSLGVLLYELLTGSTPIERESAKKMAYIEIQKMVLEQEPPTPSARLSSLDEERLSTISKSHGSEPNKLRDTVRGELDWIVMKAIEKNRERRYESAASLAADISRHLANEPVSAVKPSFGYSFAKFARRYRGALVATAAVFLALLLGIIVSIMQANRAKANEREARRNLYVADMNFAQNAVKNGNMERAIQILERHMPVDGTEDLRQFEWRYLWNQTHREEFILFADDDPNDDISPDLVFTVAISPDSRLIASVSRHGRVRVWDVVTRTQRFAFDHATMGRFLWVKFSRDGRWLAVAGAGRTDEEPDVVVWDVAMGRETQRFFVHPGHGPQELGFTLDGTLVSASSDGRVWFWNVETGVGASVRGHDKPIIAFSLAADGDPMATLDIDSEIKVWDVEQRLPIRTLPHDYPFGHYHGIRPSPDGKLLLCVPRNHDARDVIVDAVSGDVLHDLQHPFPSHDGRFILGGKQLVIGEFTGAIRYFDTASWEEVATYHHRGHQMNAVVMSDDDRRLVSAGDSGKIMVWPGNPIPANRRLVMGGNVTSLIASPDQGSFAAGSRDGSVHLWDTNTGGALFVTPRQIVMNEVAAMLHDTVSLLDDDFFAFSPDGRELAVCSFHDEPESGRASFWVVPSGEPLATAFPFDAALRSLAYSPNGQWLITGNAKDGVMNVWDRTTKEILAVMEDGTSILCLTVSPDSKFLASKGMGNQGSISVWELPSGTKVATLSGHIEPVGNSQSLAFSPDGSMLATAGYDSKVILWDTNTWNPLRSMLGHMSTVTDLAFSPDGRRLASSGEDNWCKLWDLDSGQEVASFRGFAIDFTPDGKTLAVGGYLPKREEEVLPESTSVRLYHAPDLEAFLGRLDAD